MQGLPEGQNNFGTMLLQEGQLVEAQEWLKKAASQGSSDAQKNLDLLQTEGK